MTSPDDLIYDFVDVAERIGFDYFVTGSAAAMQYGEPRTTLDVDVVADLKLAHLDRFAEAFPKPHYYVDKSAIRHAILHRGQFNILHPESGLKIDVMLPDREEYNVVRLERRRPLQLDRGRDICFASPEDVIIMKLRYHHEGGSQKHLNDVASMLKVSGDEFDYTYLDNWIRNYRLESIWHELLRQSGRA